MIQVGTWQTLTILRELEFGVYLDDGNEGILLPTRYVPRDKTIGDDVTVFLYHDGEDRIIATTDEPFATLDEIFYTECVDVTDAGAYMSWGIMKDLFVPKSKQLLGMEKGEWYFVKIYLDEQTGRLAGTEKIEFGLQNKELTVKENDEVKLVMYRKSDIGYVAIVESKHTGVLHFNDVFVKINKGDELIGYVKNIKPKEDEFTIDIVLDKPGFSNRIENDTEKIERLLKENNGVLAFGDKSSPEEIYSFFGMSKKAFKNALGNLYKEKKITLEPLLIKSLIDV
jgi:predicted RNA-binding protein (virulence factor B family)